MATRTMIEAGLSERVTDALPSRAVGAVTDSKPAVLHGLPEKVIFCRRCVMSNQRPSTSPELQKENSKIETVGFDQDGICHACRYAEIKALINWQEREEKLLRGARRASAHRWRLRCGRAGQWRQGQCIRVARSQVQIPGCIR